MVGDVTLSFHSLPDVDLRERVAAAAVAGFGGISLSSRRLRAWLARGHSYDELRDMLAAAGVLVTALEALVPLGSEPDPQEATILAQATALGATRLLAVGGYEGTVEDAARRLRALCDRAAGHGLDVALEFLPWTNLADVHVAHEVVERAGRPNAGICLDVWHLYRCGHCPDTIAAVWPAVTTLQLNDGPLVAGTDDLVEDCRTNRLPPGEGEFALVPLLRAAASCRPGVQLEVEVISAALQGRPASEAAARLATATAAVLGAAGWGNHAVQFGGGPARRRAEDL